MKKVFGIILMLIGLVILASAAYDLGLSLG